MNETIASSNDDVGRVKQELNPLWMGAILLLIVAAWILYSQLGTPQTPAGAAEVANDVDPEIAFQEATGIQVMRVALIGGGGIIALHYQVLDPDKSLVTHDTDNPPVLTAEASGRSVAYPIPAHTGLSPRETGRGYNLLFPNRNNLVKRGDMVTVEVGNAKLEHVVVQ